MKGRIMTASERRFLDEQKKKLIAILGARPNKDGIKNEIRQHDAGDMSSDLTNLGTEVAVLDCDYQQKRDARIALQKMEEATYFECSECEGKISIRRLTAIPQALVCIRCKDLSEQGQYHDVAPVRIGDLLPQTV